MRKELLPLLLASDQIRPQEERQPLDRLRMQKGVFLLQMRGPADWRDEFDFEPYDWGPYSRELMRTTSALIADELLEKVEVPGRRYSEYRTTSLGDQRIQDSFTSEEFEFASRVRQFVTDRSFTRLLRDVYAAFPTYAVNSRFSG